MYTLCVCLLCVFTLCGVIVYLTGALVAASGSNEGNLTSSEGSQSSLLSSNGDHGRLSS